MKRCVLIQNPYHLYAQRLIERVYETYGLPAVCFYTQPRERAWLEHLFPLPRGAVECAVEVTPGSVRAFAKDIAKRYDVVAILPFNELAIETASELLEVLPLQWNEPQVLARFRNKESLKAHLRIAAPDLRLNEARVIRSVEDIFRTRAPERFVLKPNDGFAAKSIGLFTASGDRAAIRQYLEPFDGRPVLLEEYVGGDEYAVNGQMGVDGEVLVLSMIRYRRTAANGSWTLYDASIQVHQDEAIFRALVRYTETVMRATGLRRCPFHLEVKVDQDGPCLIEVGARPIGFSGAVLYDFLHGPGFRLLDVAAHYYLFDEPMRDPGLDWDHYNRMSMYETCGVSTKRQHVYRVDGKDDVEALSTFRNWIVEPKVGSNFVPTTDLFTIPWAAIFAHEGTMEQVEHEAHTAHRLLRFNEDLRRRDRILGDAKSFAGRAFGRARFELETRLRR